MIHLHFLALFAGFLGRIWILDAQSIGISLFREARPGSRSYRAPIVSGFCRLPLEPQAGHGLCIPLELFWGPSTRHGLCLALPASLTAENARELRRPSVSGRLVWDWRVLSCKCTCLPGA